MGKMLPLVLALMLSASLFADGGMAMYRPQTGSWQVSQESRQLAAINYQDGMQKMLLAVETSDLDGTKLVWVFPVPAKPQSVKIGIAEDFPQFAGQNIDKKSAESVQGAAIGLLGSQIFFAPLGIGLLGFFPGMATSAGGPRQGGLQSAGWTPWYTDYVDVHASIEKNGLATELVEADTGGALYYYLKGKELDVPYEMQAALNNYNGKEYSFVVSYIDNITEFKRLNNITDIYAKPYRAPKPALMSVSVEFPTDKLYFPLMPTSVYQENSVPAWIYVVGHVTPNVYSEIRPDTTVEYYSGSYPQAQKTNNFFGRYNYGSELLFTKIYISTPSANFVQDLWMEDGAPMQATLSGLIAKNSLLISVLLFAFFSCLASYLSGVYIFNGTVSKKMLALAGLSNALTLAGFIVTTYFFIKPSKNVGEHCRMKFVALFSALCIIFGILLVALPGAIGGSNSPGTYLSILIPLALFLGLVILPQLAVAYAYLRYMKIEKGKLFFPGALALLDFLPIAAIWSGLSFFLHNNAVAGIIVLGIFTLAEGYLLSILDKKTFAPRKGLWIAALMKGALIFAVLCIYGAIALMQHRVFW